MRDDYDELKKSRPRQGYVRKALKDRTKEEIEEYFCALDKACLGYEEEHYWSGRFQENAKQANFSLKKRRKSVIIQGFKGVNLGRQKGRQIAFLTNKS